MTPKSLKICVTALVVLTTVYLAGCTATPSPAPEHVEKSAFTGIPCAAPCWHGLLIGESNKSDVMSVLPGLTFVEQSSIVYRQLPSMSTFDNPQEFANGVEILASCVDSNKQCLNVHVTENILTDITVSLNYEITIRETIGYLGSPDYIGFDRAGGGRIACSVYLIWINKGLTLNTEIFEGTNAAERNCFVIKDHGTVPGSLLIAETKYVGVPAINDLMSSARAWFVEFSNLLVE
jgi:hypothetical protein